jgi:acyl carrier protein
VDPRTRSFDDFAAAIAEVAHVPAANIAQGTRLLEDLDIDSLALTEVIVMLMVDFGMSSLSDGLERRDWRGITAGDLYEEYRKGEAPPVVRGPVVFRRT